MQKVRVIVTRRREFVAGDGFQVYGDGGTGQVDFTTPLTDGTVPFWPDAPPRAGHLFDAHLVLRHLDNVEPDGHLSGLHLCDEHLRPAAAIVFEAGPYCFGAFTHAVKVFDAWGNASLLDAAEQTTVVNSSPRSPSDLARAGFEAQTDQITFSFTPSPDLG